MTGSGGDPYAAAKGTEYGSRVSLTLARDDKDFYGSVFPPSPSARCISTLSSQRPCLYPT